MKTEENRTQNFSDVWNNTEKSNKIYKIYKKSNKSEVPEEEESENGIER